MRLPPAGAQGLSDRGVRTAWTAVQVGDILARLNGRRSWQSILRLLVILESASPLPGACDL